MMHTSHNLLRFLIKTIGGNRLSDQWTRPDCVRGETYLDALLLVRALRLQIGLVFVSPLHTQEAVCRVADAAGQHAVPQHGVHHRAFTVTGPGEHLWFKKKKKSSDLSPGTMLTFEISLMSINVLKHIHHLLYILPQYNHVRKWVSGTQQAIIVQLTDATQML